MAARLNPRHDQKTREKIQTSQLVNRLQADAFGEVEITAGQRKSAEILLKKTLPDLQAIVGSEEHDPVRVEAIERRIVRPGD